MGETPKSFKDRVKERDWAGPLVEVAHTAFLLSLDALKIFALFGITYGLDELLEHFHVKPITIYTYSIDATEIIKNFDYMLLVMFLAALLWRVGKGIVKEQ